MLIRVTRLVQTVCMLLSSALIGACSGHVSAPPKSPPPAASSRSEAPKNREREAPPLIAPPPAYGNKVVMARGQAPDLAN